MWRIWTLVFLTSASAAAFKVLYVGPPRTGTQTMYTALNLLGLRPLHSGYNLSARAPLCNYLYFNGSREVAMNLFSDIDAAMDEPFQLMYDDIMTEYPDAKFILPMTTADEWMSSYRDYFETMKFPKERRIAAAAQGRLKIKRKTTLDWFDNHVDEKLATAAKSPIGACWACQYWGCRFGKIEGMSAEENRTCRQNFETHMARVKSTIPASRLLLFNFTDGWAPLSHFLGLPIPEEPFPFTDKYNADTKDAEEDESTASFLQLSLESHPSTEL